MRLVALALFVGATFAVASVSTAQPPEGGKAQPPGKGEGKFGKGGFQPGGKGGFGGGFRPPQPGQIMPPFLQEQLKLTADQKKELEALQKDVDAKLDKLLTDDQKKQLKEMRERGPGAGFPGRPGEKGAPKKD